ncbi:patatin-like phospholipase family protein [Candidatus Venteria ishoeyi]|uniref:Patatin-like phospholipase n=1 Tax=Candidatus Venteria ishoeyi TaxID=1899563 RepID=A0A1H6FDF6_9GAMM|nr:patatin-like phospholipase family protein [Candidatus Venteria ishoeyi]SEH08077.1 Patatin-like phospholipase [Candidatus Venteria ishoeyi]
MAKQKNPEFEIGLVMAGAVSAGAYTAGVLDFLLQALEAWEEAKKQTPETTPQHQVKIKAISGASAGGISGALLGTLATRSLDPVTSPEVAAHADNKLYRSWVELADIFRMLEDKDCQDEKSPLASLLDVSVLNEIADYAFSPSGELKHRPYFDKELHILLSITNLRGVPYQIRFGSNTSAAHDLSYHADHIHFVFASDDDNLPAGAFRLDPFDFTTPEWLLLKQAALATSAFPGGLAPRVLHRPLGDYAKRTWWMPVATEDKNHRCYAPEHIKPHWPEAYQTQPDQEYEFLCVDGGVMNNEPLELAHKVLAGEGGSNPREGDKAHRAVLMVDPFPDPIPFATDYEPDTNILSVLQQMFGSLLNQARFKPDELALACQDDVYSRFMIAPSRSSDEGAKNTAPLASTALGAFGGFLDQSFREHDFHLGRRNCQSFLKRYFTLPECNPLFENWTEEQKQSFYIRNKSGEIYQNAQGHRHLPVVPLMDESLCKPIPFQEWPTLSTKVLKTKLKAAVRARATVVVKKLLPRSMPVLRWILLSLWWLLGKRRFSNKIINTIYQDLKQRNLLD